MSSDSHAEDPDPQSEFEALLAEFAPKDDTGGSAAVASPAVDSGISLQEFLRTPVEDLLQLPIDRMISVLRGAPGDQPQDAGAESGRATSEHPAASESEVSGEPFADAPSLSEPPPAGVDRAPLTEPGPVHSDLELLPEAEHAQPAGAGSEQSEPPTAEPVRADAEPLPEPQPAGAGARPLSESQPVPPLSESQPVPPLPEPEPAPPLPEPEPAPPLPEPEPQPAPPAPHPGPPPAPPVPEPLPEPAPWPAPTPAPPLPEPLVEPQPEPLREPRQEMLRESSSETVRESIPETPDEPRAETPSEPEPGVLSEPEPSAATPKPTATPEPPAAPDQTPEQLVAAKSPKAPEPEPAPAEGAAEPEPSADEAAAEGGVILAGATDDGTEATPRRRRAQQPRTLRTRKPRERRAAPPREPRAEQSLEPPADTAPTPRRARQPRALRAEARRESRSTPRRRSRTRSSVSGAAASTAALPPRASLSPTDRVIPSWTDPTVRRAATLLGGPLGNHSSIGRNRLFTPLRVVLVFALAALIVGWLAKSPCIQTGPDGELDQGGQRPWITGCYNDIVPLYGSRGLADAGRNPYAYTWVDNGPDQAAGVVYPRADVRQQGDSYVARTGDTDTAVGDADLVYDAALGYQRVEGGELVTVPVFGGEIAGTDAPPGSPTVRHLEYPVLTGYFMWGAAALTAGYLNIADGTGILPKPLPVGAYFSITAILLGLFYVWTVVSTARIARRRIWDVAMLGLAPLLMVHAFTNWDLLAIGLTAGAMAAWARQRPLDPGDLGPRTELVQVEGGGFTHVRVSSWKSVDVRWAVLAGVLLGLGASAKLYPALLLGPLLVLSLRTGAMRRFAFTAVSAVVAWLLVNLPTALSHPQAWSEFFSMNAARGPEWDSWYFLSTLILPVDRLWSDDTGAATGLLNAGSLVLFLLACAAIGWLALAAQRRPRFAQLAFLVVVAFLLTNKVFSPQYSLWLLPLVVLALPRWRPVLAWQLSEVAVWYLLMLSFDTDSGKNLSIYPFAIAAVVRDALIIMLVVMVVKDILKPERDRVRIAGDDDPSGGVFDGVEDRVTLPTLPDVLRRLHVSRPERPAKAQGYGPIPVYGPPSERAWVDDGSEREDGVTSGR